MSGQVESVKYDTGAQRFFIADDDSIPLGDLVTRSQDGSLQAGGVALQFSKLLRRYDLPPSADDNASRGYSSSSVWQSGRKLYSPVAAPDATGAAWGVTDGSPACIADIVGATGTWATSNTIFAGGLSAMKSGYVGPAADLSVTIGGTATTITVNTLSNGEIDAAAIASAFAQADAGTYVTCIKLYDQSGLGNHFVKNSSFAAPWIEFDPVMQQYVLSTGTGLRQTLQAPTGVAGTSGFAAYGNAFSVVAVGRGTGNADQGGRVLVSVGDYTASPNKMAVIQSYNGNLQKWTTESSSAGCDVSIDSQPSVLVAVSGSASTEIHCNEDVGVNSNAPVAQAYNGGWLFDDRVNVRESLMRLHGLVIAKTALSASVIKKVKRAAYCRYDIRPQIMDRIVFIGDSRVSGSGPFAGVPRTSIALETVARIERQYRCYNLGWGSQTNASIASGGIITYSTGKLYKSGVKNVAVYLASVNDFIVNGATAAQALADLKTNLSALKTAGYYVILINELSTTAVSASAKLVELRALISSAGATGMGCDIIIDPMQFSAFAAPSNTAYYPDGLHPSGALDAMLASAITKLVV